MASHAESSCFEATQMCQDVSASAKVQSSLRELQWQLGLQQRIHSVLSSISQHFYLQNLCCVQVWLSATGCQQEQNLGQMQLYADPTLALLGDAAFAEFRANSCHNILPGRYGMPGRVWIGGCVQVVQNISIIPSCLHPRSKLSDELMGHVAEVVYITVYDPSRPHVGPVAVMEALFACKSTDSMMVANFISFVSSALLQMKLTLSDPAPKPFKCSKLAGRKPVLVSEPDVVSQLPQPPAQPTQPPQQQQLQEAGGPVAPAVPAQPAAAAAEEGDEHEVEGCGDTHAEEVGAEAAGLAKEPGEQASNRSAVQQQQQQQQVLGKRKTRSQSGAEAAAAAAAVAAAGQGCNAQEGAAAAGPSARLPGRRAAAAAAASALDRSSPVPMTCPEGETAAAAAAAAAAGEDKAAPAATLAAAAASWEQPAAAAGAAPVVSLAASTRSDATAGPAAAARTSSTASQANGGLPLLLEPMHAPRPVNMAALGAAPMQQQQHHQQQEQQPLPLPLHPQQQQQPVVAMAVAAAVAELEAAAAAAGEEEEGDQQRPRKVRALTMTRTKSVPLELSGLEVASTASSKPKLLLQQ